MLIEQQDEQKHVQPAKRRPINMQKRVEMLGECLLRNQKSKNMYNQLKSGQRQARTEGNPKEVLIQQPEVHKHA